MTMPKEAVYFIHDAERSSIKIGTTTNLHQRVSALQMETNTPLAVLGYVAGGVKVERELQLKFRARHLRREWFRDCPEIRNYIAEHTLPLEHIKPQRRNSWGGDPRCAVLLKALSLIEAAELVSITGCTHRTAVNWKTGKTAPNADDFMKLVAHSDLFYVAAMSAADRVDQIPMAAE